MDIIWGLLIAVAGFVVATIVNQKKQQGSAAPAAETPAEAPAKDNVDYSKSYQARLLLTKNEWYEYKKLKQYAADKGLQVCPKVRILDIIEPRKGQDNYKSLFYKVQAKHVDFVITDADLRIKAILELDDSSHDTKSRQERDTFVDQILTSVGYKVIHTRSVSYDTLKEI